MTDNRHPAGTSIGGQWAPGSAAEVDLDDAWDDTAGTEQKEYESGTLNLHYVEKSAQRQGWGEVNHLSEVAPGVVFADCSGHGGYRLSRERNLEIPRPLRRDWYEEDTESHIVGMYHPDVFNHDGDSSEQAVKDYFPDEYEAAEARELAFGESQGRDAESYARAHADDWALRSALAEDGAITAIYTRGIEKREVRIPADEFDLLRKNVEPHGRYRPHSMPLTDAHIDAYPGRDITPTPTRRYRGIDTSSLTDRQADAANAELDRSIRFTHDGPVTSLRQEIQSGKLESKTVLEHQGKREYFVALSDVPEGEATDRSTGLTKVKKSTWDALEAPESS